MFDKIKVYYNPSGIANVISLRTLKSMCRVTHDSKDRCGVFTININKGKMEFIVHPKGVYYLDLNKCNSTELLTTTKIQENCEGHTKYEIENVIEERRLHSMMGHPSKRDFEGMVHHNVMKNSSVNPKDITNTYQIFCQDLAGVRGKIIEKKERVVTDFVEIPVEIKMCLRKITITGNVMLVNKLPFFMTF